MKQRFGRKDLVLYIFLSGIFLAVVLAMYMIDRQWQMLVRLEARFNEQVEDLHALRGTLQTFSERVVTTREPAISATQETSVEPPETEKVIGDPFARSRRAQRSADYAEGDWLVRAFSNGLKTITPLVSSDAYASHVQSFVFESLLQRNPDTLVWAPHIAESWRVSEDGLNIRFTLRRGVRFSDGEPLDADDVAFTYDFIMDPAIAAPRQRALLDKVSAVNAIGSHVVEFQFSEPYFNSLALAGGLQILPRHFYARFRENAQEFNESKGFLLGSGPYRLADPLGWTPDLGTVELERNPRYWGAVRPPYRRILWKIIENDGARLTTYRNGDIDLYDARPREYQTLLDDADIQQKSNAFDYMSPTAGYSYIGWNQKNGDLATPFADRRVRQAMTWLSDRETIINEVMLGYAEIAISPFSPRSEQHDATLQPRAFNRERALALLAEAGYRDRDGDGVLEDSGGRVFEFELVYFQGNRDTRRMVLFLKDQYASAGILLKPVAAEWSVMLDVIDKRNFDAITLGWTSGVETDIYQMLHSSQIADNGDNFVHFDSADLDQLIDRARGTVDEAQRMAVWREAERVIYREQPYTFLMRRKTLAFIDRRIHNVAITNLGLNFAFVPIETYVPDHLQKY